MTKKIGIFFVLFLISHCIPYLALSNEKKGLTIFFLGSGSADSPWTQAVNKGITERLDQQLKPYIYFTDNLEASRFNEEDQYDIMNRYLHDKFLHREPDIFIAAGPAASHFSLSHQDLFPDSRRILIQPKTKKTRPSDFAKFTHDVTVINPTIDFTLVVEEMLRLSAPEKVYIIGDSIKPSDKLRTGQITTILYNKAIPYSVLDNMELPELFKVVATLPKKSTIFYTPIYREHKGKGLTPVLVMKALNAASNAPIFSTSDSTLGFGTVGGYIYSPKKIGTMAAEAVAHLVYNQPLSLYQSPFGFSYDWNEITKWGYQDQLPAGAEIYFKAPSLWQQYRNGVVFTSFAIIFLITLSTALFIVNRKLKKVRKALLNERNHLEERVEERTIELSLLHEKAEQMARMDELTELDNRRSFFEKGETIHYEAQRYNRPYALMMLDIDHFKNVNDTYGHAAGDKVIQSVARNIGSILRQSDVAARIGGEEFATIIVEPDNDLSSDNLSILAERLREQIAQTAIQYEDFSIHITISIGLSRFQEDDKTISSTLERADKALYTAKDRGRNRVVE